MDEPACKRTASARAKGNVELCTLRKEDFMQTMDAYPSVASLIRDTIRLRKEQEELARREKAAAEEARKKAEEGSRSASRARLGLMGLLKKKNQSSASFQRGSRGESRSVIEVVAGSVMANIFGSEASMGSGDGDGDLECGGVRRVVSGRSAKRSRSFKKELEEGGVGGGNADSNVKGGIED